MIHNSGVNKGILNSIDMRYKFHVDFVGGTSWMLYLCTASLLAQFTPYYYLLKGIRLDLDLQYYEYPPNFSSNNVFVLHKPHINWTNCLTDNSRKSSYFPTGIPALLINLINPSPTNDKISLSPSSPRCFQFLLQYINKINLNPER